MFLSTDEKAHCEHLAKSIQSITELPSYCKDYDSVQAVLQKRKTVKDPFAGMQNANRARADRARGVDHHAKVQRRLTTGATTGAQRFSKLEK